MMKEFFRLLEKSVITTSLITILVVGGAVYLALSGHSVPDWYLFLLSIVVGFFFGSKSHPINGKIEG